jgi:aspartyl-tRNA(Asn)/glutamyl-tRNA(Gln) amidotransferase subunit C
MPISAHTYATTGQGSDWNWLRSCVKKTSMKLTREEVERVAWLARLRLTSEEKERLTEQLDNILRYMEKLNQLDISRVEPFIHAVNVTTPLREDRVTNEPNAEALLANAPAKDGTFFRVPKIIE